MSVQVHMLRADGQSQSLAVFEQVRSAEVFARVMAESIERNPARYLGVVAVHVNGMECCGRPVQPLTLPIHTQS